MKAQKNRRRKKRMLGMLAACGIAIAAIPFSAIPADAAILYSLDDGVLTIKSPEVIEKDGIKVPWYDERDQITSLVLRDGITEIGDALFTDLTALETIDFPDTLTTIGTNSFRNCSSLKSIELPSTMMAQNHLLHLRNPLNILMRILTVCVLLKTRLFLLRKTERLM